MRNFKIEEFVSPEMFKRRGSKCIELLDERLLDTMDSLRENLGKPITINNWLWNGNRTQSGLRDADFYGSTTKYHSSLSQHKYGRAADFLVKGMAAWQVRKHILENIEKYPHIKFLECDISWVHIDVRTGDKLMCWSPNLGYLTASDVIKNRR